ncbi:MAG: cobalt ECF transporter T component CbiQ, partial [Deltaproteobacteria bacterium]|nr:cobalt ECF transporter T component CbiQ [Deltaproteobacteria bacterium]
DQFPALLAALFFSCLLIGAARFNFWDVARRAALVNGLILLFWFVLPLTFAGEPLFSLGPLAVSREGVLLSVRITVRSNAILLAFIALVGSSSISTLGYALNRMHVPQKLVHLLLMTYRYVFVIEQEYQRLNRAARIRGFEPKTNMHTYKAFAYFIGMLFVRASARAERIHQAMLCRGFRGRFYCLREFSLSPLDWIWSVCMTLAFFCLVILEWTKTIP